MADDMQFEAALAQAGLEDVLAAHIGEIRRARIALMQTVVELLEALDMSNPSAWRVLTIAAGELGLTDTDLEVELGASQRMIARWRAGEGAPREMTRISLRKALVAMGRERIVAVAAQALQETSA